MVFVAGVVALFVFAAAAGLSGSFVIAAIATLLVAPATGAIAGKRFLPSVDQPSIPRALRIAGALAATLALLILARLTIFITDPSKPSYSVVPASGWEVHHSCATAYYVAADIARDVPNLYDLAIYAARDNDPRAPRTPRRIGLFNVDQYEYPPPFLLLPRALLTLAPGFLTFRLVWYGLCGLIVLAGP
jgi:alpha-1,2-mannosyltransferase